MRILPLSKIRTKKNGNLTDVFDNYNDSNEIWFDQVHFSDIELILLLKKLLICMI